MKPPRNQVLVGDCVANLARLPAGAAQTCVTSPPYWKLRDYGIHADPDAIGLEPTLEDHLDNIVRVGRGIARALRPDGTLWLNYGDSYASDAGPRGAGSSDGWLRRGDPVAGAKRVVPGFKPKDLMGLAWRVAFALQEDGWYLRSDVVWNKPNAIPESVDDRPARSHEYVFLLARSGSPLFWTHRDRAGVRGQPEPDYVWTRREDGVVVEEVRQAPPGWQEGDAAVREAWKRRNLWRGRDYYYDAEAVKVDTSPATKGRGSGVNPKALTQWPAIGPKHGAAGARASKPSGDSPAPMRPAGRVRANADFVGAISRTGVIPVRNLRDVWDIPSQPYDEAHFATYPEALVEPCIKAGTSEKGQCPACGAPWARQIDRESWGDWNPRGGDPLVKATDGSTVRRLRDGTYKPPATKGWAPTCSCAAGDPVPQIVLDPFGGSGTTGVVAKRLGRDFILLELNPEYAAMAERRLSPVMNQRLDKTWSQPT